MLVFKMTVFYLRICTSVIAAVLQCLWAYTQRWRGASDSGISLGYVKTVKDLSRNISPFIQDNVKVVDKG